MSRFFMVHCVYTGI